MADSGEKRMNLAALQRMDPYITSIITMASQVALYEFNGSTNEWEKTEIEGTLFVYGRCAKPYHGFIIMNRLNRNNLVEPLTTEMEFQRQDPFLLYRNSKTAIYGIWFYNKEDCSEIDVVMHKLMDVINAKKDEMNSNRSRTATNSAPVRMRPSPSEAKTIDIVSMLTKAQNEYNQTKGRTEPKRITDNAIDLADLVRPRPLRMNNSTGPPPDLTIGGSTVVHSPEIEGTSLSVAALFASAGRRESSDISNLAKRTQVTPEQTDRCSAQSGWNPECSSPVGESLHAVLQRLISNTEVEKEKMERCRSTGMPLPINGGDEIKISVQTPTALFDQQHESPPLAGELNSSRINANLPSSLHIPVGFASDISLMSPMMFSSPKIGVQPHEEKPLLSVSPRLPQINLLTRDQLGQALIHLLKNDREFLNTIHEAYVKSLTVLTGDSGKHKVT